MKCKLTISLDDSTHEIASRCGNVSQYMNDLLAQRWAHWRRALLQVRRAGLSDDAIAKACRSLNGCWLVRGAGELKGDTDADVQEDLEALAWEWWHGNAELRELLAANGKVDKPERMPVKKAGRPKGGAKAQKEKT